MQQLVKACGCRCVSAALNAARRYELFISVHSHPSLNLLRSVAKRLEFSFFFTFLQIRIIEHLNHAFYCGNLKKIIENREFGLLFFKTSEGSLFSN